MATRSTIALEFADGTVQQVYCHWDGYLSNNGRILQDYYSDPFKLRQLIDLGDISSLGPNIGEKHPFDNPYQYGTPEYFAEHEKRSDSTTFYGRDRGETGVKARRYANYDEYTRKLQGEEYNYILRNIDGRAVWFVSCYDTNDRFVPLEQAFKMQKDDA